MDCSDRRLIDGTPPRRWHRLAVAMAWQPGVDPRSVSADERDYFWHIADCWTAIDDAYTGIRVAGLDPTGALKRALEHVGG